MNEISISELAHWRRAFHRYPESGWTEFVTTATLVGVLRESGFSVMLGPAIFHRDFILGRDENDVEQALEHAKAQVDPKLLNEMDGLSGCVALLDTGKPGPVFAFRFDIDCVQVHESSAPEHKPFAEGFASSRPGLMHACGHDGHAAIGLGVAQWLMANKASLNGVFKLIFQPAEEGARGARPMTESGILDDVNYFLAMHVGVGVPPGEVWLEPDCFQCSTKLDVHFYGQPAHAGAEPHLGKNALAGACNAAMLMLATPRHWEGTSRINVGKICAGEGRNVIPTSGLLQVEVRGATQKINDFLVEHVMRCAQGSALVYGLEHETRVVGEAIDLTNSREMVDVLHRVVDAIPALKVCPGVRCTGSEDATIMVRHIQQRGGQAAYFVVGSTLPGGHHQATFDFDENALETGVMLITSAVTSILTSH